MKALVIRKMRNFFFPICPSFLLAFHHFLIDYKLLWGINSWKSVLDMTPHKWS